MQIIAEGVETSAQSEALVDKGVRFQQGYLFAKPLSTVEFIAFWHESHQAYIQQYDDTDMPDLYALKEE